MAADQNSTGPQQAREAAARPDRESSAQAIASVLRVLGHLTRVYTHGFDRSAIQLALEVGGTAEHPAAALRQVEEALTFLSHPAVSVVRQIDAERFMATGSASEIRAWLTRLPQVLCGLERSGSV